MYLSMYSTCKIGIMSVLVICLSPVFTEAAEKRIFSNSSFKTHSSNFNDEIKNNISREYVKENLAGQKWKMLETSVIKILSTIYNDSLPFISQLNNDLNISPNCKRDLMSMLLGLKDYKYWAVRMLDSFGKLPSGIVSGTVNELGDYDQCLDVNVPGYFQGQYCSLDMIVPMPKREPFTAVGTNVPGLMSAIKPDGVLTKFVKYGLIFHFFSPRGSICVPSTCSKEELQTIANKAVLNMNLLFELKIPNCEILKKEVKFDRSEITIMTILGVLVFLAVSATAVDVYLKLMSKEGENVNSNLNLPTKVLLCFSIYTNIKRLLSPDVEEFSIKIFHGMRFISTMWVILVHTSLYINFRAVGSMVASYDFFGEPLFQVIGNGFINVQTFFFMSGTLHSLHIMKMKGKINIQKHIFRRIWRLVPAFMLVIGCVILIPHLGSGPVWKETVHDLLAKKCREKWWTNLLFMNNFISNEDMCLQWLWYIPVDFHLYIISLLVLIPMKRNPILAFKINVFIMVGAMIISAALHLYYKLTPMLIISYGHPEDLDYFLERGYFRTYLHYSSVSIGLMVGYFLSSRPRLHIPAKIGVFLWMASSVACLAVLFGVYRWNQGHIPSTGVSALYAGGSKILWTASMAWVTIACTTGNGGIVTKILSWSAFVPLSRLCYMTYLIHSVLHYMHIGSTRSIMHLNPRAVFYMYFGHVVSSLLCAFVLSLLFESPFMALDKLMFSERTSERSKLLNAVDKVKSKDLTLKNGSIPDNTNGRRKIA